MSVITYSDATAHVSKYACIAFSGCGEIAINEPFIIESDQAWVFPYNTRAFLETGDFLTALVSNNPVLVCRGTGSMHIYNSGRTSTEMLESFVTGDFGTVVGQVETGSS